MCVCVCVCQNELKSSYNSIISAVGDFFDLWNPSTATPRKKCMDDKDNKINLIC